MVMGVLCTYLFLSSAWPHIETCYSIRSEPKQ